MENATMTTDSPGGGSALPTRGLSVRSSLLIAIAGAIVAIGVKVHVLRNEYSVGVEALLAGDALVGFGIDAYGLLQAVLAVIDTAGERRRQDRVVSERRHGDRARQPRK
jgi:hypothetical protein